MKTVYVTPDNPFSKSAHEVRLAVGKDICKFIKDKTSPYVHKPENLLINWGSKGVHVSGYAKEGPVINPTALIKAMDARAKLYTFWTKAGVRCPKVYESKGESQKALKNGKTLLVRAKTKQGDGADIVYNPPEAGLDAVFAPFSTSFVCEYIPKTFEYRIHIFRDQVIAVEQKVAMTKDDTDKTVDQKFLDWRIRSRRNGFMWTPVDTGAVSPEVITEAKKAAKSLKDFTFGAVELVYSSSKEQATVIDIDGGPILYDSKVSEAYARAIRTLAE